MAVNRTKVKGHERLPAPGVISSSIAERQAYRQQVRGLNARRRRQRRRRFSTGGADVNGRRISCRHTRANVLIDATLRRRRAMKTFRRTHGHTHKSHVRAPTPTSTVPRDRQTTSALQCRRRRRRRRIPFDPRRFLVIYAFCSIFRTSVTCCIVFWR